MARNPQDFVSQKQASTLINLWTLTENKENVLKYLDSDLQEVEAHALVCALTCQLASQPRHLLIKKIVRSWTTELRYLQR
jgi:hypothetical protein